jgi:hypothetical protein
MLRAFADGQRDFDRFHEEFYYHFTDDLEDNALSEEDWAFFGKIHEKLDYVSKGLPDPQSRADGWISDEEFRTWLRETLQEETATGPAV